MTPDAHTRFALLLGDPVGHSLSPLIHNTAFRTAGIPAVYLAARVSSAGLAAAVAGLRALGALGANVTIPHKEHVRDALDRLSPQAEAIGAVNTIVRQEDGTLTGHNTDAAGFLAPLNPSTLKDEEVLILGSGGAARATAYALLSSASPRRLTLAARTPARAEALAADLAPFDVTGALDVRALPDARSALRQSALVVNATPVGMHPRDEATPWETADDFHAGQTVYDLIYTPRPTRLLREAESRGARPLDGLAMLIGQAAEGFRLWTGQPMPLDAVRAALDTSS